MRDHCVNGRENVSERTMHKMLISGREELVDEFTEFYRGDVRHKRTLKRKYVKRKGGGE